jgi:hypothetical protein
MYIRTVFVIRERGMEVIKVGVYEEGGIWV